MSGTLTYNPNTGGELELIGTFSKPDKKSGPQRVYGIITEGERITIPEAHWENESVNSETDTFRTERYSTSHIFVGAFIEKDERFWKGSISFPNFEKWTEYHQLQTPGNYYVPPGPARTETATLDDADIILEAYEDVESAIPTYPGKAFLSVYLEEPDTFENLHSQYLKPLQNLLTLCEREPVFPTFITAYTEQYGHKDTRIKVYKQNKFYQDTDPSWRRITLPDLDFPTAVENWFNNFNASEGFHHRYFSQRYNDDMHLESKFIDLIVGLEMYHRQTYPSGKYTDEIVWDQVRDVMKQSLPNIEVGDRIGELIDSIGNDYSLGDRLEDIISNHKHVFDHVFDPGNARSDARDARIDLAHGLDKEEMDIDELHRRKEVVDIISTAILHDVTGVDPEKTRDILERMYHY